MDFGLTDIRYQRIKAVFNNYSSIDEVIIFGSRAMNTYRPASDIDLAIKGQNITHTDILKLYNALDKLPYGYTYDILNYNKISNPELIKHIDTFGCCFL